MADYIYEGEVNLRCDKCDKLLEPKEVQLSYMDSAFNVTLPSCPICGMVYIPEELAKGRMKHVEKSLEDK
ncbi:MAG: DVU_1557 family redox protein [Suipraeoptans sp.]